MPKRIQRRNTKGWRKPEGAVYVGRGSKWGNPYVVGETQLRRPRINGTDGWELEGRLCKPNGSRIPFTHPDLTVTYHEVRNATAQECVYLYARYLGRRFSPEDIRRELAGKDLMCWCPLDAPCHADVLLDIANPEETK